MMPVNPATITLPGLLQRYRTLSVNVIGFDRYLRLIHAFHSLAIDGCSLSLIEMEVFHDKGLTADSKLLTDHLRVLDQVRAFEQVLGRLPTFRIGNGQPARTPQPGDSSATGGHGYAANG